MITEDTLREIDGLIEQYRWARATPACPEFRTYVALKAAAKSLRAGTPERTSATIIAVQRRVDDVVRIKTRSGHTAPAMIGLAQEVIARWATIRAALLSYQGDADAEK